jgi:VanZ family protein
MGVIFYMSSQSSLPSVIEHVWDKLLHVGGYVVLGGLIIHALSDGFRRPVTIRDMVVAVALTTLYGASDEVHQAFVPMRTMDVRDLVADATGGSIAAALGYVWSRLVSPKAI